MEIRIQTCCNGKLRFSELNLNVLDMNDFIFIADSWMKIKNDFGLDDYCVMECLNSLSF